MAVKREKYSNAVETVLSSSINNSTTTVAVADGSTFPADTFRVKVEDEIMIVTSRSSNTLTVVRGQEGTTAASHSSGIAVNAVITAGALAAFRRDMFKDLCYIPKSEGVSSDDDDFDDENFSGWTKVWNGSSPDVTPVENGHQVALNHDGGGAASLFIAFLKAKSPTNGDWISCGVQFAQDGDSGYMLFDLMMTDGATHGSGHQDSMEVSVREQAIVKRYMTGFNSTAGQNNYNLYCNTKGPVFHMKMVFKGNGGGLNLYDFYISNDGENWYIVRTNESASSAFTITHMGFAISVWGLSNPASFSVKYVRFSF